MKRITIIASLLLLFLVSSAQKNKKEELITFTSDDGTVFTVGDTVRLGSGSHSNGQFNYIYTLANFFDSQQHYLAPAWNGKFVIIDQLRNDGNDKIGYTKYILFKYGGNTCAIQLESAIAGGEVITPASKKKLEEKNKPIVIQQQGSVSIADELKKLKELLDAGVLTQAEYDAQKKKILEK